MGKSSRIALAERTSLCSAEVVFAVVFAPSDVIIVISYFFSLIIRKGTLSRMPLRAYNLYIPTLIFGELDLLVTNITIEVDCSLVDSLNLPAFLSIKPGICLCLRGTTHATHNAPAPACTRFLP